MVSNNKRKQGVLKSNCESFVKTHLHATYLLLFTYQYFGEIGDNYTLHKEITGFFGDEEKQLRYKSREHSSHPLQQTYR